MSTPTLQSLPDRRERFLAFVQSRVHDRALAEDILQAGCMRALLFAANLHAPAAPAPSTRV